MKNRFNRDDFFLILSIGTIAGFSVGFISAFSDLSVSKYFHQKLFYLVCLCFKDNLNKWTLSVAVAFICLFAGMSFTAFRFSSSLSGRLCCPAKKVALVFLSALFFLNMGIAVAPLVFPPVGPNLVLIIIDCLKPDHLGCYGYKKNTSPFFDGLAGQGVLFKNTYTNAPWTKPSVATLFTSLYPNEHKVINSSSVMPDAIASMAEIFKDSGYSTVFFNGGNAFLKKVFGFNQGFDSYIYRMHSKFNGTAITGDFLSFLGNLNGRKFFAYLHFMDAHLPYTKNRFNNYFTKKGKHRFKPGDREKGITRIRRLTVLNELSDSDKQEIISFYDGQIRFVDENINVILKQLKNTGIMEDTIVVITADHGEEFWEHNNFEHGHSLYNELLHVPLLIAGKNIKHRVVNDQVRLVDILPTVLSLCNIKTELNFSGVDLSDRIKGDKKTAGDLPVFATGTLYGPEKYSLIKDGYKIIENTDIMDGKGFFVGYASPVPFELYNVKRDYTENNNIFGISKKRIAMQGELNKFKGRKSLFEQDCSVVVIDRETRKKLEALGYVK